jgi:micrococcal nuclease
MERLREFVQNRRNAAIVLGGLVAVAVIGCCLIGIFAITAEPPAQTEEQATAAAVTEVTSGPLPTEEPTQTAEPTDTAEPSETPTPTATSTPEATATTAATEKPTNTPEPTDTPLPSATPTPEPTPAPERVEAQVVEVVDGDTIRVAVGGEAYSLRYIGIDAPEMDQPGGTEARNANAELLMGQTVRLEKDVSETDQYDRLLRYVYLANGTFVNAELVRLGYARAERYEPDVKYQDTLEQMEQQARDAQRGLWQATSTPPPTVTAAPSGGPIIRITYVDKRAEYVEIENVGGQAQDLSGWTLVSEKGNQRCPITGVVLEAGNTLRIWALAEDADQGGYNCGLGSNIWNNSEPDPAALYDAANQLVDRYP